MKSSTQIIKQLQSSIDSYTEQSRGVLAQLKDVESNLVDTLAEIKLSKKVSKKIVNLDKKVQTVDSLLRSISVIPKIKEPVKLLRGSFRGLRNPLRKLAKTTVEVEKKLTPIKSHVRDSKKSIKRSFRYLSKASEAHYRYASSCIQSQMGLDSMNFNERRLSGELIVNFEEPGQASLKRLLLLQQDCGRLLEGLVARNQQAKESSIDLVAIDQRLDELEENLSYFLKVVKEIDWALDNVGIEIPVVGEVTIRSVITSFGKFVEYIYAPITRFLDPLSNFTALFNPDYFDLKDLSDDFKRIPQSYRYLGSSYQSQIKKLSGKAEAIKEELEVSQDLFKTLQPLHRVKLPKLFDGGHEYHEALMAQGKSLTLSVDGRHLAVDEFYGVRQNASFVSESSKANLSFEPVSRGVFRVVADKNKTLRPQWSEDQLEGKEKSNAQFAEGEKASLQVKVLDNHRVCLIKPHPHSKSEDLLLGVHQPLNPDGGNAYFFKRSSLNSEVLTEFQLRPKN